MFSRNRSTCGVKPYIRATCNPDGESWVAKFIDWWIDPETGYADESRCGKLRYFVRKNNIIHWANTPRELYETFNLNSAEEKEDVKSVAFISAKLTDNEAMMKHDPGYMGALKAMSEFDQEQLLYGNWKIRKAGGHYFKRSKIGEMLSSVPSDVIKWVRAWDLAATAPSENDDSSDLPQAMRRNSRNDDSAYTAGVLLGKTACNEIKSKKILVGIVGTADSDVLKIAHAHEYGTKNLPERSFIRASFDANINQISDIVSAEINKVLSGEKGVDAAANSIGAQAAQSVQNYIDENKVKPQSDFSKKTQHTTLYETGTHIRDRIAFEVITK